MKPDEIQPEYENTLNVLAKGIDEILNGKPLPPASEKKVGFILLIAEFGKIEGGRVNYISNGERADMVAMMSETLARFQGRVDELGKASQ